METKVINQEQEEEDTASSPKKIKLNENVDSTEESNKLNSSLFNIEQEDLNITAKLRFNDVFEISSVFRKSFGSKAYNKPTPPNYFLCIKVNNEKIIKAVDECQKSILDNNPELTKAAIKIETLHITLFAMHLKDEWQINVINEKLLQHKELLSSSIDPNLNITFQGLSTFRNQVVYVDLLKDEHYNNLIQFQKKLVEMFEMWGISLSEKNFTPHMTLMKLSKFKGSYKKGIKKIDKKIYENMIENHFGVELVDMIHLCNIREKQDNGFYKIEGSHQFFGSNKPSN